MSPPSRPLFIVGKCIRSETGTTKAAQSPALTQCRPLDPVTERRVTPIAAERSVATFLGACLGAPPDGRLALVREHVPGGTLEVRATGGWMRGEGGWCKE